MQHWILLAVATALLAGCEPAPTNPLDDLAGSLPSAGEDTCDATRLAYLIGKPRQVAEVASLPPRSRIIGPGDAVTMDYLAERLNVSLDDRDIVIRLSCG